MGAGHWSWRSSGGWATSVVHVDDVQRSFDEYRKEAEEAFSRYVHEHYADRVPEDGEVTFEWAEDAGLQDIIETAIGDEFPRWNDASAYMQEESEQRYDDLLGSVGEQFESTKISGVKALYPMPQADFDPSARVIACSKWAQAVVREWESNIYFAVGPSQLLEDLGEVTLGTDESRFIAKLWAACDPKSTAFYLASDKAPALIELTDEERAFVADHRGRPGYHPNGDALTAIVERLREQAAELDTPKANEEFFNAYGISPYGLATKTLEIEGMIAFVEEFGGTPDMVMASYERDREALHEVLLQALAINGEKPYRPNTAWTSKPVNLSPYRSVAMVQLDAEGARHFTLGDNPLAAIASAAPSSVAIMRESDFDAWVMDSLTAAGMSKAKVSNGDMFTLMAPATHAGPVATMDSAVLLFRGCLEWGHFAGRNAGVQSWMERGGAVPLEELPSWLSFKPAGTELRSIAQALPAAAAGQFFDGAGDLSATGAFVQSLGDSYNTVFVTTASDPKSPSAVYKAVVFDGQAVNAPSAPSNTREVTYG